MDLADKDFKTVIIQNIYIFKDFKENMSIMRREMEDIKKGNLEMKSKISEIKISLNRINNRLDSTEEIINNVDFRDNKLFKITTK